MTNCVLRAPVQFRQRRLKFAIVEGSGCRPSRTVPLAPWPASGSLQGRNPREVDRWRCGDRYGYLGLWSLSGEVVITAAGLVFGERRSRNRSRWCGRE